MVERRKIWYTKAVVEEVRVRIDQRKAKGMVTREVSQENNIYPTVAREIIPICVVYCAARLNANKMFDGKKNKWEI